MSKQIRLVIGEGDHQYDVGVAYIDSTDWNNARVHILITDSKTAVLLGGNELKGIISREMINPTAVMNHAEREEKYEPE